MIISYDDVKARSVFSIFEKHPHKEGQLFWQKNVILYVLGMLILACLVLPSSAKTSSAKTSSEKTSTAKPQKVDAILAIINDDIILMSEFNQRYDSVLQQIQGTSQRMPPTSILRKQVLERLIIESIQLQMAKQVGIKLSDQELSNTLERIAKLNGLSTEAFKAKIESSGTSFKQAREQIRRERIISEVQRFTLSRKIEVTETDIDLFLESEQGKAQSDEDFQLAHILIQISENAGNKEIAEKSALAAGITQRLRDGEEFAALAISQSDGQNALKGGDLGWRSKRALPSIFASIAPKMAVGDVSDPIRSNSGFHIIKLVNKRGGISKIIQQRRVRHLLLEITAIRNDAQTQTLIKDLRKQVIEGAKFEEVAKKYSNDPGSANSGGDLGWISPGEMVKEFENVVQSTPINSISPIFKTDFGWHFLEVLAVRETDVGKVLQRNEARELLFKRRFEEELPIWLRQIRSEAFVDIKDRFLP